MLPSWKIRTIYFFAEPAYLLISLCRFLSHTVSTGSLASPNSSLAERSKALRWIILLSTSLSSCCRGVHTWFQRTARLVGIWPVVCWITWSSIATTLIAACWRTTFKWSKHCWKCGRNVLKSLTTSFMSISIPGTSTPKITQPEYSCWDGSWKLGFRCLKQNKE